MVLSIPSRNPCSRYKCSCCLSTLVSGMRELLRYSSVDWSIYLTDEPQLIDNDRDEENVTEV